MAPGLSLGLAVKGFGFRVSGLGIKVEGTCATSTKRSSLMNRMRTTTVVHTSTNRNECRCDKQGLEVLRIRALIGVIPIRSQERTS